MVYCTKTTWLAVPLCCLFTTKEAGEPFVTCPISPLLISLPNKKETDEEKICNPVAPKEGTFLCFSRYLRFAKIPFYRVTNQGLSLIQNEVILIILVLTWDTSMPWQAQHSQTQNVLPIAVHPETNTGVTKKSNPDFMPITTEILQQNYRTFA